MDFKIPHSLQEAIRENKVIIFAGAGLSKAAGLPLWKDIVIEVLENPAVAKGEHFKEALNHGIIPPLYVLDAIKGENRKEIYQQFESSTSILKESELYKHITAISRKIITTNYDRLIEHNTGITVVDTSSQFNLQKLDDLSEFILKIHGTCDAIDNATIFTSDYDRLYETESGLAKFQLQKLVSSYSCLFIGFSLSDNYVTNLFDHLNELYNGLGRDHFVISTEKINHDFVETIKLESHSDTEELLKHLANFGEPAKTQNDDIEKEFLASETDRARIPHELSFDEEFYLSPGHDTPPKIENWAGRIDELKALKMEHKACFITGIGGQGKSALASKFLTETDRSIYQYCDWRDFKEEELNFQSKLYGLIELVSEKRLQVNQLIGLDTDVLVDIFFRQLGEQRGVFVFDNIDKYIDLQKFTPTGDMKAFFDKIMGVPHNSKFIFTCRPFIQFAGVGSYQIRLEGLKVIDAEELIAKYHPKLKIIDLKQMTIRLHQCTRGHPLWMGLILAQSRTDLGQIDIILNKIERRGISEYNDNFSSIVSATVLEDLWRGLKERERVILRTLSISNISESEEELAKIVSRKINHNQFSKAMRSLKSLNLLISKESEGFVELHPLVREFISGNYGKEEQESYIGLYVSYLDGFIYLLKKKFGKVLNPEDIDVIIKKIEILISAGRTQDAINELRTVSGSLLISGFTEEYLRLSDLLLDQLQWTHKKLAGLKGFLELIESFFVKSSEFGRHDLFDKHMAKYTKVYQTPDTHMILAKSALCHRAWVSGDFESAIREGKSAADLIDVLGESDVWSGKHILNLALRDSRIPGNIDDALRYFCGGKSLHELMSEEPDSNSSAKLGNIGRCLLYQGNVQGALAFISKSYAGFMKDGISYYDKHNLGYASKWIAEMLQDIGKSQESTYFLLHARNIWKNDMPGEANKIDLMISQTPHSVANQSIISLETWQISKFCDDWVVNHPKIIQ